MSNILEEVSPIRGLANLIDWFKKEDGNNDEWLKQDIEQCKDMYCAFHEYVSAVIQSTLPSSFDKINEREDYLADVEHRDTKRRRAHERAIDACKWFNRMCKQGNLPRFCPEIPEENINRELIGEFASYVTIYTFNHNAGIPNDDKIKIMQENLKNDSCLTPIQDDVVIKHHRKTNDGEKDIQDKMHINGVGIEF